MHSLQPLVGRCFVPQHIFSGMLREAELRSPLETGGVLLGVADALDVWVDEFVGPGPGGRHRKTTFVPDSDFQAREIAAIYERSGRRATYLGDWHTHPNSTPHISWRDKRTLRTIARSRAARQPEPLMLIFGGGNPWEAIAWRCKRPPWYQLGVEVIVLKLVIL